MSKLVSVYLFSRYHNTVNPYPAPGSLFSVYLFTLYHNTLHPYPSPGTARAGVSEVSREEQRHLFQLPQGLGGEGAARPAAAVAAPAAPQQAPAQERAALVRSCRWLMRSAPAAVGASSMELVLAASPGR